MPNRAEKTEQPTLIVTGGGTGGHLYPALAVAEAVRRKRPAWGLLFYGRDAEKDRKEVESRGLEFVGLPLQGLRRRLAWKNLRALALSLTGAVRCFWQMRRRPRGAVFGVGGYVSAPAMLAGRILGWKIVLHEQNTVPGLVNRTLARWCDLVFVTYEKSKDCFEGATTMVSGLPVRPELLQEREEPVRAPQEAVSILVIGGSQGAKKLVEQSLAAFALLSHQPVRFHALIQTGESNYHWAQSLLRSGNVTLTPFIYNMANAYNHTDLILSRAGSGSLSEIALWGLPSILVPYPFASENHQQANAEVFETAGAAVVLKEEALSPETLAEHIRTLIEQPERRRAMGCRARSLAREDAAEIIADRLIDILEKQAG